jgi:hypothetical protein
MFNKFMPAAIVVALFSTTFAMASTTTPLVNHDQFSVGQGDIETQFAMVPEIFAGDADQTNFTLNLGVNYFLTDVFAPGIEFQVEHQGGATGAGFLPNLKAYYPGLGRVLPYFQVGLGYAHFASADLFDFRLGPGIDFLLSNTVAIGIQLKYDLAVGDVTIHRIAFPIDFAIYFKL